VQKIRKAIIPAAGLGTRFLPATKAQPKEMLPIVDKPAIQFIMEEAIESGIEEILIITGRNKRSIEDHFDRSLELELQLKAQGKYDLLKMIEKISDIQVHFIRQKEARGLGHAVLCARGAVAEPFAVINADDYYGTDAFRVIFGQLQKLDERNACMVGYRLKNTVSEHGTVTRGVCAVAEGALKSVTETFKIGVFPDGSIRDTAEDPAGRVLDPEAPVSMNFWGFHPSFFSALESYLEAFLRGLAPDDMKSECLLPALVDERIRGGKLRVEVLHTDARWFGMTYAEDRELVRQEIRKLHDIGVYPPALWD